MTLDLPPAEIGKVTSARRALDYVKPDMKLGLGTGSTAAWLVKLLAHEMRENGLKFTACATSSATTELAESLGIKIHALDDLGQLDLAIDGADEFDPDFNLIKGGGAALLQEKIVETAADKLVIITDASKQVKHLGAFPLPVEVVQFGWGTTKRLVEEVLSFQDVDNRLVTRRGGDTPIITDEGHYILDLQLDRIGNPRQMSDALLNIAGVVETGLFLDMADVVVMGNANGTASVLEKGASDNDTWIDTVIDWSSSVYSLKGIINDL
jgi:ribose 5-phosphate isomerase A